MWKKAVLIVVATALAACSGGGSEFIGKWVNVKSEKRTMVIERNGDAFIIRDTGPSVFTGKVETKNIPATLKDGALEVQTGLGSMKLVVDKSSGNLTNGQAEYKRTE